MSWKMTFAQDTEISGVGTATATFTDEAGEILTTHSDRIDNRDGETISVFLDQCLAKYAKRVVVNTDTLALLAKIEVVLNEKTGAK